MSDNTPTQRFDAPLPSESEVVQEQKKNRGLMIALIAVGAAILIAIIVLLIVLVGGNGKPVTVGTNTPTEIPSSTTAPASASATPTTAPTPSAAPTSGGGSQPTGATFTKFSPTTTVKCYKSDAPNFTPPPIPIAITWASARTQSAWIIQGTDDAADAQFMQIPVSGNQTQFPNELDFPCYQLSTTYTITLVGDDGRHVSKSWKITNVGDHD